MTRIDKRRLKMEEYFNNKKLIIWVCLVYLLEQKRQIKLDKLKMMQDKSLKRLQSKQLRRIKRQIQYRTKKLKHQKIKERQRLYMSNRLKTDINFRIKHNLRSRFYNAMKRNSKKSSVLTLLGCSIEDLKKHLETKFKIDMTWHNYGYLWEIDHKIPLTSENFNLDYICNFNNLQPLYKSDNRRKYNKISF